MPLAPPSSSPCCPSVGRTLYAVRHPRRQAPPPDATPAPPMASPRITWARSMPRHLLASALVWVLAAVAVAGCGGGGQSSPESAPAPSRPAPPASEFPSARGKTLEQILDTAHGPSELIVLPAGKVFHAGQNRFAFSIFTKERKQVADAEAAL